MKIRMRKEQRHQYQVPDGTVHFWPEKVILYKN